METLPTSHRVRLFGWSMRRSMAIAGLLVAAWMCGLFWFAGTLSRTTTPVDAHADAIIVLTGGKGRLKEGFALLEAGKASQLFISGVSEKLDVKKVAALEGQTAPISPEMLACCVTLGYHADNTIGNAEEAAAWLKSHQFRRFYLVTSHYHIRRALLEFRMTFPEASIIPVTVAPDNVRLPDWWEWPGTASLIVTEYNKYLVTYLRYLFFRAEKHLAGSEDG